MRPRLHLSALLAGTLLFSGCEFIGNSIFPARLAYIQNVIDLSPYIQGDPQDVEANVLIDFSTGRELLFVLDSLPTADRRLVVFDSDLKRVYQGNGNAEAAGSAYGRLMMLDANLDIVVGDLTIPSDFSGIASNPSLSAGDDRFGFSDFDTRNWILEVTGGPNFMLTIEEYDDTWAFTSTDSELLYTSSDPSLELTVENALYLDDEQQVVIAIHAAPVDELAILVIPLSEFPGSLSVGTSLIEDEDQYLPDPPGIIEDVEAGSVYFTTDGIVYYDNRDKRLKRTFADQDSLQLESSDGDPVFAFSLLADYFFYIDPGTGELFKMSTWW